MPKIQTAERILLGSCRTATLVEEGKVGSTTPAEEWHRLCRGAAARPNGQFTLCECSCHDGHTRCIDCGRFDVEVDPERHVCADREDCANAMLDAMKSNPMWDKIQVARERAAKEAQQTAPAKAEARAARRAETKAPQRCHHCGGQTKGGNFVMGHDMKLKGILLRAARDGDERALAEFMARGWFKDARTHKVDQEVADQAEAIDANSGPWLAGRVADRLRMIDAGVDPEEAVRTQ